MDPNLRLFFPTGPPPAAIAPADTTLDFRIKKLAEFAARNGKHSWFLVLCYVSIAARVHIKTHRVP